jgi:hypothetical protein
VEVVGLYLSGMDEEEVVVEGKGGDAEGSRRTRESESGEREAAPRGRRLPRPLTLLLTSLFS